MREILLSNQALSEFDEWLNTNTKIAKRILKMFKEMERSPFKGTGKPEPLKHDLMGYWSRRIDEFNRIVYKVENDTVIIKSCKYHY